MRLPIEHRSAQVLRAVVYEHLAGQTRGVILPVRQGRTDLAFTNSDVTHEASRASYLEIQLVIT